MKKDRTELDCSGKNNRDRDDIHSGGGEELDCSCEYNKGRDDIHTVGGEGWDELR